MLLLITDRDIEKAAQYLVREHGENAARYAEHHAGDLRYGGLEDIAEIWQRIAQRIGADLQLD
jgi:hypothetical protein